MAIQINGAIFLHIPKTGGTFVTNYFKNTGMVICELDPTHINGKVIREIRNGTEDLIFCFVRHPLTWYRSYWQMVQNHPDTKGIWPIDPFIDQPFHSFIRQVINENPGYLSSFFREYTDRCRAIGKQENLRNDLDQILKLMQIPYDRIFLFNRPGDNFSNSKETYSYGLALDLMKSEKEIIRRFNYNYLPEGLIT